MSHFWPFFLKNFHGQQSNEVSQKSTPKIVYHTFGKNNLPWKKSQMSSHKRQHSKPFVRLWSKFPKILSWSYAIWTFGKRQLSKPCITLFTRITKKRHGQILNGPLQKTMFQITRHTFDKQPDSTTNTGHNKYYDETNPIMKLTNIVRIHGASYKP